MTLDEVIQELSDILNPEYGRYDGGGWYLSTETEVHNALVQLKRYKNLLQGMQDKGIKKVTLADKQTVISAEPKAEQTAEKVSHVVRDSGNLVCECGQGVERWHMYCYHCGKKLVWDKVK